MIKNNRFYAVKKYAFSLNYHFLHDLYSPIIGNDATNLYINLIHEAEKQARMMNLATNFEDFFKQTKDNYLQFAKSRGLLEAMGLITTYLVINKDKTTYTFILNEPLTFNTFIQNPKFRFLLTKQIGDANYQKLEYMYATNRAPEGSENVSATFETIFNNNEVVNVSSVDFSELYSRIASSSSTPIIISDIAKGIVESYMKSYDLTMNEIERMIYDCVVLTDDNHYHVDSDLLKHNLHKLVSATNNVNVLKNIKLNRNNKMFIQRLSSKELSDVFNDYMTLNSEQYLRAIVKTNLQQREIEIIKKLREKYHLNDYTINMLIDYTLFKTNGYLNEKYISKVANTVNILGLNTLDSIYNHFHYQTAPSTNNNQTETVLWELKD